MTCGNNRIYHKPCTGCAIVYVQTKPVGPWSTDCILDTGICTWTFVIIPLPLVQYSATHPYRVRVQVCVRVHVCVGACVSYRVPIWDRVSVRVLSSAFSRLCGNECGRLNCVWQEASPDKANTSSSPSCNLSRGISCDPWRSPETKKTSHKPRSGKVALRCARICVPQVLPIHWIVYDKSHTFYLRSRCVFLHEW